MLAAGRAKHGPIRCMTSCNSAMQEAPPLHHRRQRGERNPLHTTMASKSVTRPLGSFLRTVKGSNASRCAVRSFATTVTRPKELAADVSDMPNMRHAQRGPQGVIHAPVVNPADKVQEKAGDLHQYGQYLLSCLPKYIQQYVPRQHCIDLPIY